MLGLTSQRVFKLNAGVAQAIAGPGRGAPEYAPPFAQRRRSRQTPSDAPNHYDQRCRHVGQRWRHTRSLSLTKCSLYNAPSIRLCQGGDARQYDPRGRMLEIEAVLGNESTSVKGDSTVWTSGPTTDITQVVAGIS